MSDPRTTFLARLERADADAAEAAALRLECEQHLASVVVALNGFEHHASHHGVVEAAVWARGVEAALEQAVEDRGGRLVSTDPMLPSACFEDARVAVDVALDLGRRRGVACAVSWGSLLVSPAGPVYGAAHARARRLAMLAGDDVVVTDEVLVEGGLGEGVGSFRAPEALEALCGGPFHVLFDGR